MIDRELNRRLTTRICELAHWIGHPFAIAALGLFSLVWLMQQKGNIGWDGFLAAFTMLATIVIQASQNRDTAAIHAKLDELIKSSDQARDSMIHLEELPEEEINQRRRA